MKKTALFCSVLVLIGVGCGQARQPAVSSMAEKVSFQTSDGVTIVGNWYGVENPKRFALLLHMMPATKESWALLAEALKAAGVASLAIDFRGHGESTQSTRGTLDYKKFSDAEQQAKMRDVEAAVAWLKEKGAREETTALVGASIGANLAMVYGSEHHKIPVIVALSPGLDYHGVSAERAGARIAPEQKVLLAAAEGDTYSFGTINTLASRMVAVAPEVLRYRGSAHGTDLFATDLASIQKIVLLVNPV